MRRAGAWVMLASRSIVCEEFQKGSEFPFPIFQKRMKRLTIHMHSGLHTSAQEAEAARASEGRWPRICERARTPAEASREFETARPLRVAMISLHTSPLAPLGRTRDAG